MSHTPFQKANLISVSSSNCLNSIHALEQCTLCTQVCPEHSLVFQDNHWKTVNCSLCGLCAMICPTQVFQIDQYRIAQYPKQDSLSLCCTQNTAAPAEAHRINCLQQFSPLSIFYILYQHSKITLYLSIEQCQNCQHQWYAQGFIQQLEQYQIPIEKLQIVLQNTEKPSTENQRRELFRDLFHRTEKHSKHIMIQAVEKLTASFSSKETETTQAVFPSRLPLYALYVKHQLPVHPSARLPFHQLECTDCNFCTACTYVCPTQALTIQNQNDEKQLQFQPELCINCNLCQNTCMQKGLQWDDFMTQQQFLQTPKILAHSAKKICNECEHEFYQWPPSDEVICSLCKIHSTNKSAFRK